MNNDTIAAVATPPGQGGVGIIRISGSKAKAIAMELSTIQELLPRIANFSSFLDSASNVIDQGIVLFFKAPHSFTGEDVVELHAHGSPIVLDLLLEQIVKKGARIAKPGEFTERAFLNDKIDLTQAEAIADLIQASSKTAAKMAVNSLQGRFSKAIQDLSQKIIHLRMYVEAAIDFPEEEIDFLADGKVAASLNEIMTSVNLVEQNACQGVMMREGISVVIAGRPNAGKSTLINALCGKDVAIVTDIAGTTRDVMREHVLFDDVPVHLVDTAGLHESDDPVEKEGIKRAWDEVSRADCVLLLLDIQSSHQGDDLDYDIQQVLPENVPVIRVVNKIDQKGLPAQIKKNIVYLSAKSEEGLDLLISQVKKSVGYQPVEGQFLARRRHLEALSEAKRFLVKGQEQLTFHHAGELLADDLRMAHKALSEITGEYTSDDLLGEIFSSFCIGK